MMMGEGYLDNSLLCFLLQRSKLFSVSCFSRLDDDEKKEKKKTPFDLVQGKMTLISLY